MSELKAVLFDIDGTMMDNNEVHLKAWKQYLKENDKEISEEDYNQNISGKTSKDAIEYIYDKKLSEEEAKKYYNRKEEIYREMFEPEIKPINGLQQFLEDLKKHNIKTAIATSGVEENIDFMFEHVPVQKYFEEIISASDISKGKPDPEIFLKAAEAVHVPAENCIVFEDSMAGVKAGKSAGMKVVALTTTHSAEELKNADLVIKDYTEIDFKRLESIIK